jgi:hypothetical protein
MNGFILGLFLGLAVMVILVGFWNTLSIWRGRADAFYKPQKIVHFTEQTPAEVKADADATSGYSKLAFYTLFLIGWLAVDHYYPRIAHEVYDALFSIFKILLDLITDLLISLKETVESIQIE